VPSGGDAVPEHESHVGTGDDDDHCGDGGERDDVFHVAIV
jgi:hypothetical protein